MISISKPMIGKEEIKAVIDVLQSGSLVQGKNVKLFEREFAEYIGTAHAAAVSSGTAALHIALECLGIRPGDEVITTPFTFIATANAVLYQKAKPVFADIKPDTYNINPDEIKKKITDKTKAVIAVHLYGNPCDMEHIAEICREKGIALVEDCAQAAGAEYKGKKVGGFGDMAVFSFYATKNMSTGEGGMIAADKKELVERAKVMINQGQSKEYEHVELGYNYRMTEIQAAIGMIQLKNLDSWNRMRIENANFLTENLKGISGIGTPIAKPEAKHVFHQYTIKVLNGKRGRVMEHLKNKRIDSRVYYPKPVYLQPFYLRKGFRPGLCPVAEKISEQVLSLPVHPGLTQENLNRIVSEVKNAL